MNCLTIIAQASGDYDPSFVTEALKEIQYSDTPKQDIDLLKDVAAQAYTGQFTCLERIPRLQH